MRPVRPATARVTHPGVQAMRACRHEEVHEARRFRRARDFRDILHRRGTLGCLRVDGVPVAVSSRRQKPCVFGGGQVRSSPAMRTEKGGPPLGVVEKPSSRSDFTALKTNPPYPPLTGGYKKAMRPRRAEGVLLFLAPLSRGGRGGCLYGVSLSRKLFLSCQRTFQRPPQGGSGLAREPQGVILQPRMGRPHVLVSSCKPPLGDASLRSSSRRKPPPRSSARRAACRATPRRAPPPSSRTCRRSFLPYPR